MCSSSAPALFVTETERSRQAGHLTEAHRPPLHYNMSKEMVASGDATEAGQMSLRTSLNERKTVHAVDLRKQSLFQLADTDHSGMIDQAEFGELYDVVREQTEKELLAKMAAQFLGRPATSAGVERMFSKAGKLHDERHEEGAGGRHPRALAVRRC